MQDNQAPGCGHYGLAARAGRLGYAPRRRPRICSMTVSSGHGDHDGHRHDRIRIAPAQGGAMAAVTSVGETPAPTMIWIRLRVRWLERDDVLQPELYAISRSTPNAGVIFSTSFAARLLTFVLLLILSYAGRIRRGRG
jgi:hypothetical protein